MYSGSTTPLSTDSNGEVEGDDEFKDFLINFYQQRSMSKSLASTPGSISTSRASTATVKTAPAFEREGENVVDPDDTPLSIQPHTTDMYRRDAEDKRMASEFHENERTLDLIAHGEFVEEEEEVVKKPVDNSVLMSHPEANIDDTQEHLAAQAQVGLFRVTPAMEHFKKALENHFCDNACMQFIQMPGANRLNHFGPLEGMAMFIMDDPNPAIKKPMPASFLFNPVKYGFGTLAAKLPSPADEPSVVAIYEALLDFNRDKKQSKRSTILKTLLEYCNRVELQYAGTSCGFYMGKGGVTPDIWIVVLEGDKSVNSDFQALLEDGEKEKYSWKMTFFDGAVSEDDDSANVYRLNKRAAETRRVLADGALKACGLTEGLTKCSMLTDIPHNHMTYSTSEKFFCYFSGCVRLNESERLIIAKDPINGFTMYSGDAGETNVVGLGKYLSGSENTWGVMPCVTGKTKLLSSVKLSPTAHDPNPFIVNAEGNPHFARKLGDVHRHFDINFQSVLNNLGLHILAERTDLSPLVCVISDHTDENLEFVNTLFQDLFE